MKKAVFLGALSLIALAGCSGPGGEPNLAAVRFESTTQPVTQGKVNDFTGVIKTTGGHCKGVKLVLKGSAFSYNLLSTPVTERCSIDSKYELQRSLVLSKGKPFFTRVDPETFEADLPDFEIGAELVEFTVSVDAQNPGKGNLTLEVIPTAFPAKAVKHVYAVEVRRKAGGMMLGS